MSALELTRDNWARLLDQLDQPPLGAVAEALSDARDVDVLEAYDVVEAALEAGVLVEEDTSAYGFVRLAESDDTDETPETADRDTRGDGFETDDPQGESDETGVEAAVEASTDRWAALDLATEAATYPPELLEREQWMGQLAGEKIPFAPWGDADHPDGDPDKDARYKWGIHDMFVDGDTVALAEDDPRLDGRVFLQQEDDPFAFVDGDDVRDPETGDIHPAFLAFLDHLGVTYGDVSTSGSGVHAYYRGELPGDLPEAKWEIDSEPFGANDDLPAIEIYANTHVNVTTGDHLVGTGTEVRPWDDDALEAILEANDQLRDETPSTVRDEYDLDDYEPSATSSDETTDDIRDVFRALDRLDAKRVGERTIVREWTRDKRSFLPTWGSSKDNGTANYINDQIWHDTGKKGGYGGPVVMAAIDAGLINHTGASPADVRGKTFFEAVDHLRDLGFSIPVLEDTTSADEEDAEYRDDPRAVTATVDPRRAWDAAGRVTPDQVDGLEAAPDASERFATPSGEAVDVVRAVAIAEGLVDDADAPLDDQYPEAYERARTLYGAPLPEYYTTADAIAEFDAVLDVIGEATYWDLDTDSLATTETARDEDVGGDAVRALNPAWRESESEASVLVFDSGTIWDADTKRVLDVVRFAALDAGIVDEPGDQLAGEDFTAAYAATRERGAPLPRWEPASDGGRTVTAQLPPAEELLDVRDVDGVDPSAIDAAREDVEALVREVTADAETPSVVTALPATGKTTGTIKTAVDRPTTYLAPRKELQAQALDKADRWGVDARILPVFSDETVASEVLEGAKTHVRDHGKDRLRDRWSVLSVALDGADDDVDAGDIFAEEEEEDDADDVDLDRATCPTADGEHGPAWALAVHTARSLGYTPREIHTQARGLFGAELPCTEEGTCPYAEGWEDARDPDNTPDLLVGSYVHAHVESARTAYSKNGGDRVETEPRAVVLDEFVGEAFVREFDDVADDHATWLARSLREDVDDRRDAYEADLAGDDWVSAWLRGEGESVDGVEDAIAAVARTGDLLEARDAAAEILDEVDAEVLEALDVRAGLETARDGDAREAVRELGAAVDDVDPNQPGAALLGWVRPAVLEPLTTATRSGADEPSVDGVDTDALPIARDLAALVDDAVEAARGGADGARERLEAAAVALRGGERGCRRLAAWADDGYAHPDAHHLLAAIAAPSTGADAPTRIHTSAWAFDDQATEGTSLDVVETGGKATTVLDRNGHGALLHTPPARVAAGGGDVPLVGLDATGRSELWSVALGEDVEVRDIHDTAKERAAFLEDALDLRVIQAARQPRYYEGNPASKDTDGDVALLETLADQYAGIDAPRERGAAPSRVGRPAAITTKGVREVLEADDRLDDVVSAWDNYGNVTGSNELGDHRLAAILGCQHYGDDAVERFAALAGESVDTDRGSGRGDELAYGSELGDAYLAHMTEDQTTQGILRFARGDSGATVVARTSALGDDLPVVGDAQVVKTWSDTATAIAREYRRLGREFTTADVRDVVDVSARQVRRVLSELADAGYVRRVDAGVGRATSYERVDEPSAGDVKLPERTEAVSGGDPGHTPTNEYYTWNVRVRGGEEADTPAKNTPSTTTARAPPAPTAVDGLEPPS